MNVEGESAQIEEEGDVFRDRQVVGVTVGERRQHVEGSLPACVTDGVLVKVGQILELLRHRLKDEIALGVFLHLSTVRDVNTELLAEQLDDVFRQFFDLPSCVVATLAHAVQQNVSLKNNLRYFMSLVINIKNKYARK